MPKQCEQDKTARFPVFVIGSPRSGTSMLHWALCQHELLWGSEESELLQRYSLQLERIYVQARQFEGHNWLEAQQVDADEFFCHLGKGIDALYASRAGDRHWVEQTPSNTWSLPQIKRLLPSTRFLFIHRDGRQVVESMIAKWHWGFNRAAKTWSEANRLALEFERDNHDSLLRIAYEDLVFAPQLQLNRIWQFLELEPCPGSVSFIVDQPPINASLGYENQERLQKLEPRYKDWSWLRRRRFRNRAHEQMRALGYPED